MSKIEELIDDLEATAYNVGMFENASCKPEQRIIQNAKKLKDTSRAALLAEFKRLEKALRWYADKANFFDGGAGWFDNQHCQWHFDNGETARAALAKIERSE